MSSNQTGHTDGVAGLKKYDMKLSGVVFMIYCLCGAGAFGIEEMIPAAGPGMTIVLLIIFPIVWSYPICNVVAECGSVLPAEGGPYIWLKEAFGEFWAVIDSWWSTIALVVFNGTIVSITAGYISQMIPMSAAAILAVKVGMVLIFTIINLIGIRGVGNTSTVLSILILLAFILVAIVGLLNWQTNPMEPFLPEGYSAFDGISGGICICIWMYCGYESLSGMAGELTNPQVIPKGVLIAVPLIALTYIFPVLGGLASLPAGSWQFWDTGGGFDGETIGYATILTEHLGSIWGYIFLAVAVISQSAIFNTYIATGSRGFFVMADDRLCPAFLTKISKKRGVPYITVILIGIFTLVLTQYEFTTLVMAEVIFMMACYVMLSLAAIKLRKKYPIEERKAKGLYVIPGGKAGLALCTGLPILISIFTIMINGTDYLFLGLTTAATGPVVYLILKLIYGGMYKKDPKQYPLNKKTKLAFGDLNRLGVYILITGILAFGGQFWCQWYEIDYGMWLPETYTMFGNHIPLLLDLLKWGGLALIAAAIVLFLIGRRIETEENKLSE